MVIVKTKHRPASQLLETTVTQLMEISVLMHFVIPACNVRLAAAPETTVQRIMATFAGMIFRL